MPDVLAKEVSDLTRKKITSTSGYDEVVCVCPSFGRAVDALPSTELAAFTNVFLRELFYDAVKYSRREVGK